MSNRREFLASISGLACATAVSARGMVPDEARPEYRPLRATLLDSSPLPDDPGRDADQ